MSRYLSLGARLSLSKTSAFKCNILPFHPPVPVSICRRQIATSSNKSLKNVNQLDQNSNKDDKEGKWYQRVTVKGILTLKDFFDYIVYGTFAVALYYAYKNYDSLKTFKKEIDATSFEVEGFKHKFYKVSDYVMPEFVINKLRDLKAFEVKKEDVWVASFPKSGTTWVQELVFLIQSDADFDKAKARTIEERSPFFEYPSPGLKAINRMSSPRIIKTHMPLELLPDDVEKKSKVVYVLRNPKDVAISFFYFIRMNTEAGFKDGLTEFIGLFKDGKVPYGPWWKHVDGYTGSKNVHIIHYEDLHTRPKETLKALCQFLGKELDDKKLESIEEWCSFDAMKSNPMVNYEWNKVMGLYRKDGDFFRKGKVGDWLNHFSTTQSREYDAVVEANLKYKVDLDYGISSEDLAKIYTASDEVVEKERTVTNKA